jgi:predicted acyltransferase
MAAVTVAAPRTRLLALDVFRGATVAGMLLVNNPGTWGAIYPPLEHAAWHGWTPTDLIFPFFLFIVGVTTQLSLTRRREAGDADAVLVRRILLRGLLIVVFGLLLNAFPYWPAERWTHLRYAGVLQRIGVVYVACALLVVSTGGHTGRPYTVGDDPGGHKGRTHEFIALILLLFGYWFAMAMFPLDDPSATLAARLDRAILGTNHIWQSSRTWDPEGPLSTLPAIGTAILGVFAGRWLQSLRPLIERVAGLACTGAIAMAAGLAWGWSFPINKNLWTSSYVLFTGGMAALALAVCLWLIDDRGMKRWTVPFEVFGVNPLLAFIGTGLMGRIIGALWRVDLDGHSVPVKQWVYERAFASWLEPRDASLVFAICFVLLWLAILWPFYRRRVYLKV